MNNYNYKVGALMYEEKFVLLEGSEMTTKEIASELEALTGYTVIETFGDADRVIAQKPNFDKDYDTFNIKFEFNESDDFVDAVVTTNKRDHIDFKTQPVKVRLISYQSR